MQLFKGREIFYFPNVISEEVFLAEKDFVFGSQIIQIAQIKVFFSQKAGNTQKKPFYFWLTDKIWITQIK